MITGGTAACLKAVGTQPDDSDESIKNNNKGAQLFLLATLLLHAALQLSECRPPPAKRSSSPPSSGASVDLLPPAGIIESNSN